MLYQKIDYKNTRLISILYYMYQFKNNKCTNRKTIRYDINAQLRQNEFNNNYAILEYSLANNNVIVPFFSFYLNKCILNNKNNFILKKSIRNITFTMNPHKHCDTCICYLQNQQIQSSSHDDFINDTCQQLNNFDQKINEILKSTEQEQAVQTINQSVITTKQTEDLARLMIEDYADKKSQNFIKFFKDFAKTIKIDLNYKREKDETYKYNNNAILMFDQKYKNQFIPIVLEIDFDSFYPNTLLQLNDSVDNNILKLMTVLQKYRQYYKDNKIPIYEKIVKFLQCAFIGCLGSTKKGCKEIVDLYAHSLIMEQSRQTFMKLVKIFENNGKHAFFRQTDACFCVIDSEDEAQQIYKEAQELFPCKVKIHKQFYHFKQMHKYVSLVDNKPFFKGFARDCDWFGEYIYNFITKRDPLQFLKAYENPLILSNQTLLDSLSRVIIQFPDLMQKIKDKILIRADYLGDKNDIRRFAMFINPKQINEYTELLKSKYNQLVSFHEIMIRDVNSLVFDIDIAANVNIDNIIEQLKKYINDHPLIKALIDIPKCFIAYYKTSNKTSAHIKFDIQLPLSIQREIANYCKNHICSDIDTQIYSLGKSLRLPQCSNIKKKLTKEQMIQQQLQLHSSETLEDYLFTTDSQQQIKDKYLSNCLANQRSSFPYTCEDVIDDKDDIQQLITKLLQAYDIIVTNVDFTGNTCGEIHIKDNNTDCFICKRKHDQDRNRIKLRFSINYKKQLMIHCYRPSEDPLQLEILLTNSHIKRDIQLLDDCFENAKIINQRYILKNKTDKYEIPIYQIDIIRSAMGTGKSELFSQVFKKFKKVLMVATRKVFTLQNILRFGLEESNIYWNQSVIDNTVICQLESLGKINENTEFDVVILDEIMSILQQLYRDDKNQAITYCDKLNHILMRSKRIIISDATVTQSVVNFFQYCFPKFKLNIIDNIQQIYTDNTIKVYREYKQNDSLNYIEKTLIKRFKSGKKSWAVVSQKSEGIELQTNLMQKIPNAKIKVFNGDQDSTEVDKSYIKDNQQRQIINNINLFSDEHAFDNIDIVICNAAITSGLNVTNKEFDFVICNIHTGQISPQQLVQALHRTRYVKNIELFSQSLQTQYYKKDFYTSFIKGMTRDSHYTFDDISEKLYSLSKQYVDDLNTCGLEYVIHQLRIMGYTVIEEPQFQHDRKVEKQTKYNQRKSRSSDDQYHPIIDAFMQIIPSFITENERIQNILDDYKDCPREDQSRFKEVLDLARYQVYSIKNSDGFNEMFEEKKYDYNPILYTDVLKQYLVIYGDLKIDFEFFECNDDLFDKLMSFIIQYTELEIKHGKTFRTEFIQLSHQYRKQSVAIQKFTQSEQFKNKKDRYKFYRETLQCNHRTESHVEKLIQTIAENNLFQYNAAQISELLETDKYKEFARSRIQICNYLGYYAVTKKVGSYKQQNYKLIAYNHDYIPTSSDESFNQSLE